MKKRDMEDGGEIEEEERGREEFEELKLEVEVEEGERRWQGRTEPLSLCEQRQNRQKKKRNQTSP